MPEIYDYNTDAQNNNAPTPDGFRENMQYSEVNDSAREVMAVIARHVEALNAVTTTGTGDAYLLNIAESTPLVKGRQYIFQADRTNTTDSPTLQINSLAATAITNAEGAGVAAGTLVADGVYFVVFNGVSFMLIGVPSSPQIQNIVNATYVRNLVRLPKVEDAAITPLVLSDTNALQVNILTHTAARTLSLSNANITIADAELWIVNAGATALTLIDGVGNDLRFSEREIAVGDTAAIIRVGSTNRYYRQGCWT